MGSGTAFGDEDAGGDEDEGDGHEGGEGFVEPEDGEGDVEKGLEIGEEAGLGDFYQLIADDEGG